MARITRRALAVVLAGAILTAGALVAAGCGEGSGSGTTVGPSDGAIAHPGGKNEIVLQISSSGGFVPVSWALTQIPEFTLYGDGTVIVTGPVIAIYPGPALPNLQVGKLSQDAIQAILVAAREAGLFTSGVDYGRPGITDVNTTNITINAGGTTYLSQIYALGVGEDAGGLTMEQQQARAAVSAFVGRVQDPTAFEGGEIPWAPYEYSALAVFSTPVDPAHTPGPDDIEPNRLEWPLGDPSTLGSPVALEGYRRVVVSGEELTTLQTILLQATQITIWTYSDTEYNLHFRPLLPDEND